jgi:hypothetical protein
MPLGLSIVIGVLALCLVGSWSPGLGFVLLVTAWYAIRWVQNNPMSAALWYGKGRLLRARIMEFIWPN